MASKFQIPIAFKSDPRGIQEAQGALQGFGSKLAGIGAAVASAFAVRAVFNFGKEAILAAEGVATANARLEAIAKATQVFGTETSKVTKSLIAFAEAQEMVIAVDAEVIKGVQAQLLSFKKLSASAGQMGGVFDRVTKAAFDMAAAGFGSAESNAVALGKAFEDPIRGLTALRRSGTVFTEDQQKLIKTLVDSGDLLGAQTIILNELETQYGGTAEATANFSDKMSLAFENVKEALGKALLPTFERFATFFIEEVVPPLTRFFEDDFPRMLDRFATAGAGIVQAFAPIGAALKKALQIPDDVGFLEGLLDKIAALPENRVFGDFVQAIVMLTPELLKLLPPLTQLVTNLVPLLLELMPLLTWAVGALAKIFGGLTEEISGTVGEAETMQETVLGLTELLTMNIPVLGAYNRMWRDLTESIAGAVKKLADFLRDVQKVPAGIRFPIPSTSGARALGGPVSADRSYLVGERGPELFTPGAGGFVTPNNRLGGGSSTNINITVNAGMGANGAQLGQEIVSAIKRYERASGPVFASA
jgi:hypothetical protein